MNIKGKNAIITGGIRGIGLEIGKKLLRNHLEKLCIFDILENNNTIEELRKQYPNRQIIFQKCDVTKKDDIERCYKSVFNEFNRFDILVNSAGIFNDINAEQTFLVNVVGTINSSLCAMQYMSTANGGNGGCIINIASTGGLGPAFYAPVYTSSKWGVVGFTRSMGHEYYYNTTGVKYITICPGMTKTNLQDQSTEKLIFKELIDYIVLKAPNCIYQDITTIGNCIVQALAIDKNGSVFICDCNVIKEVELTELTDKFVTKNL